VAPVLGSRSTDTLSGLGPPPLRPGFVLPIGSPRLLLDPPPALKPAPPGDRDDVTVTVHMGPRDDWFTTKASETLLSQPYTLSVKSNRVGARLTGPALTRATTSELPSEGIVLGAIQVPADGQPLIFLADHPTTGGYPIIAVVDHADLPLLAQARPGTRVWFVRAEPWT
jgi:allophanate hydrolase subunit 2